MASSSAAPTGEASSQSHDFHSGPSASLSLSSARQALVNDIIELYCGRPTYERIRRYTHDCMYEDQYVRADDRYQVARFWFALPHLFETSTNEGYQVVRNDADEIQFKLQQVPHLPSLLSERVLGLTLRDETWKFKMPTPVTDLTTPVTLTTDALVTLTLDPDTINDDTVRVKHHQEHATEENYNMGLLEFTFKKWQADQIASHSDGPEVEEFRDDKRKVGERYWSAGRGMGKKPL